jgi:hypothetical protein
MYLFIYLHHWMPGWWGTINWKGDETKQSLRNQDIKPTFTNRDKEKPQKYPVTIDCVPYQTQTGQLHITDLVCYHHRNLFSSTDFLQKSTKFYSKNIKKVVTVLQLNEAKLLFDSLCSPTKWIHGTSSGSRVVARGQTHRQTDTQRRCRFLQTHLKMAPQRKIILDLWNKSTGVVPAFKHLVKCKIRIF